MYVRTSTHFAGGTTRHWTTCILFLPHFSTCEKVTQLPRSYDYSYDGSRSRVRAAGASGWALRWRRGRAPGPVQGRRSAQVAEPAKHSPRPCSQRRAGPRQKGLPTNASPSRKTPQHALLAARGGLGAGPGRERNPAQPCSSGPRSRSLGPEASAGHLLRVRGTCCACVAPRPSARPRPPQRCKDAGDPFL